MATSPDRVLLKGIRLANLRVFEGEHFFPIDDGLTVFMGRNNAGKSTVLRAPFLMLPANQNRSSWSTLRRDPGQPLTVALRFQIPKESFRQLLGFDTNVVSKLSLRNARGTITATQTDEFKGWSEAPLVEIGWFTSGGDQRLIRLVGKTNSHLESVWQGRKKEANVPPWSTFLGGETSILDAALTDLFGPQRLNERTFAFWEHHTVTGATDWITQSGRRLADTNEQRLQEVLTFLRLKHPKEFEQIAVAFGRAFPEFAQLDFIDVEQSGFHFRPGFPLKRNVSQPVAREQIGSGAWTYLCILTATRAAKATGAKVLMLDEPHLYLHPGLERRLIRDLTASDEWDGEPLQIIAATHSPAFVNAALERGTLNVIDWKDRSQSLAHVKTISSSAGIHELVPEAAELLYADKVIFVEGPSDVTALKLLLGEAANSVRWVQLQQTDKIAPSIAQYFRVLVQAHGGGMTTGALLIVDGDKKKGLTEAWSKLDADEDPQKTHGLEIVWSNAEGNDLEANFCDTAFLKNYFASRLVDANVSIPAIEDCLKALQPTGQKKNKGCTVIRTLHARLLGEQDEATNKSADLENLVRFFLENRQESFSKDVAARLEPTERALREFLLSE